MEKLSNFEAELKKACKREKPWLKLATTWQTKFYSQDKQNHSHY